MAKQVKVTPDRLRQLYEQTKNPIYIWQAIADAQAIPDWCLPYLLEAAINLTQKPASNIAKALLFSRQGKRNAYADREIDRRDMNFAKQFFFLNHARKLGYEDFRDIVLQAIEDACCVQHDQAQRILARGRHLQAMKSPRKVPRRTAKLRGEVPPQLSFRLSGNVRSMTPTHGVQNGKKEKVEAGKNAKAAVRISAAGARSFLPKGRSRSKSLPRL